MILAPLLTLLLLLLCRLFYCSGVAKGGMRSLFPQPVISETYYNYQGTQDQQANGTCGDADGKLGPDADLGRSQEGVPYGEHIQWGEWWCMSLNFDRQCENCV